MGAESTPLGGIPGGKRSPRTWIRPFNWLGKEERYFDAFGRPSIAAKELAQSSLPIIRGESGISSPR